MDPDSADQHCNHWNDVVGSRSRGTGEIPLTGISVPNRAPCPSSPTVPARDTSRPAIFLPTSNYRRSPTPPHPSPSRTSESVPYADAPVGAAHNGMVCTAWYLHLNLSRVKPRMVSKTNGIMTTGICEGPNPSRDHPDSAKILSKHGLVCLNITHPTRHCRNGLPYLLLHLRP